MPTDLKMHVGGDKMPTTTEPVGICVTIKGRSSSTASMYQNSQQIVNEKHSRPI